MKAGDARDIAKELQRIEKELVEVAKQIARSEGMLGNPKFIERASAEIVEKERNLLASWQEKRAKLEESRSRL